MLGGGGNREYVFNGYRVSVQKDEKVSEMDDSDDCTTMGMYLMPPSCISKNGLRGKSCIICILLQ